MTKTLNPEMLKIAREARKLSQSALAKELTTSDFSCSQVLISKIEAGILTASEEFLKNITKTLHFPEEFFYADFSALDMSVRLHRKRVSLKKEAINYIDSCASIYQMAISKLFKHIQIDVNLPSMPIDEYRAFASKRGYDTTPEIIAEKLREAWQLPKGPIRNLIGQLEKNGVFVFELDLRLEQFDAVSFYSHRSECGFILVNKNFPVDRKRFTLAHELGHIIMHRSSPSPKAEDEANMFASEFLMPTHSIQDELKGVNFWDLKDLKEKWGVSMAALIMKAKAVKGIDEYKAKSLFVRLSQNGYRKKEPDCGLPEEQPTLMKDLFTYFLMSLSYSKDELLQLLSLNKDNFKEFFSFAEPNIQPIRFKKAPC